MKSVQKSSSQAEIRQLSQQKYAISGIVDFSSVPGLIQSFEKYFKPRGKSAVTFSNIKTVVFDLSPITDCNSAGLALLLDMERLAQQYKIVLYFKNLPATLMTIAKAYGAGNEIRDICR